MKLKKYEITENKNTAYNSQYIKRDIEMSTINRQQKYGYHMLNRQLKTIR